MAALSRRTFLERGATLVAAGFAVPSFIAETARMLDTAGSGPPVARAAGRRILVIVQFAGGNDGLNALIPFADPAYGPVRPTIAIPSGSVLNLNDRVGLHPSFARLKARYDRGQVALVQGAGYPNPNRSHFRGTDIWESAVPDRLEPTGWVGRYLGGCGCQRQDHLEALTVGSSSTAGAFWTEMALVPAIASISSFRYTSVNNGSTAQRNAEIQTLRNGLAQADGTPEGEFLRQSILTALTDADVLTAAAASYTPRGSYPNNSFGNSMKLVAQLVAADVGTSIFYVSLGGFDTHANQLSAQASLFATFDQAVDGFFQDLESVGRAGDVALMTFSEFGRRVAQNGSGGTDHGTAAPMFLVGGGLNGGLHGAYPSLTDLASGDLKMTVDFRQVYAAVLEQWLGVPSNGILGGSFPPVGLFTPLLSCAPRPPVHVTTTPVGGGQLQVTLTAGGGLIRSIAFERPQNALVDIGGTAGQSGSFIHRPAAPTSQIAFAVRRAGPGAVTVPLVVADDCGEWRTFVGGGAGAF
ncbi:MAG: DUF1501 domain-containing protein [Chloroflexi bacterium]|nr:DUF1501 domain-containing protein [Chloroflexota bacterium]